VQASFGGAWLYSNQNHVEQWWQHPCPSGRAEIRFAWCRHESGGTGTVPCLAARRTGTTATDTDHSGDIAAAETTHGGSGGFECRCIPTAGDQWESAASATTSQLQQQ
jgi:hypothetical protein